MFLLQALNRDECNGHGNLSLAITVIRVIGGTDILSHAADFLQFFILNSTFDRAPSNMQ